MRRQGVKLPTLTITSGQAASSEINLTNNSKLALGSLVDLIVYAPTTLPETIVVQLSWLESPTSSDWRTLAINGIDVSIAANRAVPVPIAAAKAFRLFSSSGNVGADRVFPLIGQVDT